MKRILCLTLALLMTLSGLLCLPACSGQNNLPADFVKGDEIVIDNETPFVYDESTVKTAPVKTPSGKEEWHVDGLCGIWNDGEEDVPYSKVSSYFGNKIIRHRVADGQDTYYTVYSLPDNQIYYVFFRMKDDVLVLDPEHTINVINLALDIREKEMIAEYVYEYDLPSAIIGDKLPAHCYLDYYEPEEIERRNNLEWEFYGSACGSAGLSTDPYKSDFYCELYAEGRHKEVDGAIRCIQSVSFDTEEGDPESEDYTVHHGAYFYDIYVFTDGTGILFFTHFNTDVHPRYAVWQREEIKLSTIEVEKLTTLLDVWDFNNIPTWNPEEFSGFDGETTTVFTSISGHHNLTSMWSASERDAVYHIREAIEEIVRDHVTVERGRIYNLAWYEK